MAGEAFDPDAFLAEEPFDPDAFLADQPSSQPVETSSAPPVNREQSPIGALTDSDGIELAPLPRDPRRLSDPYAGQRAQYEEEQRHREALVREAFSFTKDPGLAPEQVDLKVAQHFGIPEDVVARNRDQWLKDYARASGDPKAWIRDNPLAAKLVLDHPERAEHIVNNKEMTALLHGWNKVVDFVEDNAETIKGVVRPTAQVLAGAMMLPAGSLLSDQPGVDKGPTPAQLAARAQRDAPKPVVEVDDAEAARIREAGTPAIVAQRAKEARHELEIAKKYHALSWARTTGKPTLDLEREIYRMEQAATPKYLGETGWRQALSEVVGTSMSTVDVVENVVEKGGTGAAFGTAAGLAVGAAARNPSLAMKLAGEGAKAGLKWGSRYGAAEGSFILENGSSYRELLKVKTEAGLPLTDAEARGGAAIAALLKTGIELAELSVLLKAMGPAGELLRGGGMKAVREALMTNPGFRAAASNAAKSLVANGIEEVSQDAVDQAAIYAMKSHRAGALEKGPVFDAERLKENFVGGLMGGTLFGAGGLAFTSAQHAIAQSREQRSALAVPELVKLAGDPTVQSMPDAVAKLIAEKTAETGDDQTHVYMDPAAFIRYFQNDETKANQKAIELLGPTGPQQMAAAAVFGSNAEIPNAAFLRSAGKDLAAGMVDDLALHQGQATPRQLKQKAEANEKWAKELAEGIAPSETLSRFDVLEDQLIATGTHTPSEAKAAMTPLRDALINLAKKFGKTTEDLFRDVRIRIDDGTALLELLRKQANASERLSKELLDGLPNEEKARRLYIDPVSGLRNRRGFDETLRTPGRQVAVVTSPDIKALNDDVEGGHDTSNDLLRVIGAAVGEVDPNAARSGTNFLLEVDSPEHLEQVMTRLRAALPDAALTLEGATAANLDDAFVALDAKVEALRSEATPADKRLGARGTTRYDLSKLKGQKFAPGKAKENLAGEFVTKAGTLLPEEFFREAYQDKQVPGVLSATAWNQLPRKAHVASIDIKGLKDANRLYGKDVGDKLLKQFAQVAERNDASDFDFAHLSGDEYAAQSDNPEKLASWLAHVRAELEKNRLPVTLTTPDGAIEKRIRVEFRSGVGEKTYGAADRALNRAKAEEKRTAEASRNAGGDHARAGGGVREGAPRGEVGAQQGKPYERTRAPRQGFIGLTREEIVAKLEADDSNDGGTGPGDGGVGEPDTSFDFEVDDGPTLYEQNPQDEAAIEKQRAAIARMKEPGRTWASAELDYIVAGRNGTPPDNGTTTAAQRERVMAVLLKAGFPDPGYRVGPDGELRFEKLKTKTADADRLFATDAVGDAKGWTQLAREGIDRVFRVALVQKADKSTFLHESAHVFLELFADLAERADAPKSVLDDWQTTMKWLGVEGREGIKREHHEKWAKAWEFYLAKGEYPADRLAGAFQRFRLWMMAVYKQLSAVGGEINEDIKGVFDRLLATDAEIDASKARMGLKALPREALGLDAVAYAEYLDEMQKATSTAAQLADHQVAKDQLRATEDWWKSALAEEKKKAAEAYENLPARRAQQLLQGKPAGDFLGVKEPLNRAVVEAMVGEKNAKRFKTAKDGVHPDDVVAMAEGLLGYATGKDMLEAVLKLPDKDVYVDLVADHAVREQFPGVIEERQKLRDLVAQGLHGTATKAWVLKEFKALNARVSQKPGEMPPAEVLKRAAEIAAGGRPAGRLQARDAQVAERQAAHNAAAAAAQGNFPQAAVFKRQQLLNMYLFDALTKAKKEVEAFEDKGRQMSKTAARQRLGKADPRYRDAVDTLLGTFDVAEPEPGLTKSLDAVLQEVEKLMAEDQTPVAFDRALLVDRAATRGLRGWRELPLEDVRHIMKALQNIEAAARNRSTVLIDEKRVDTEVAIEGLTSEAEALERRPDDPTPEAATTAQWFGKQWTALDGALLKPETLSRFLSGSADTTEFLKSWWFRAIVAPMQKAKVRELDLGREVLKPLVEAFDSIPNSGRQMEKIDSDKLFPDHVNVEKPQRRFEILMMLLNAGNQSNLDRLTKGRGITEEQLRAAAVHVGITKEEYDWVQLVWDTAEKLKPLAFDLEEKHTGVRPEAVTPRPFQTPFGEYAGGYFPAVYSTASSVGARQEAQLAQFKDPSMSRPSTTHNYLKSRVEDFSDVLSLSPSNITRHFALVLHDVAFREAVQSVGGLLSKDAVRQVMRERVGDGRAKQLLQWVGDVAQMRGIEGFDKSGGLARLAMWMRGNFVTSVLGYKVPNALEDFTTNLTSSFNASDLKPQHLVAGLAEFYATGKNSYQMALGKSGELRARRKQVQRELAKGVKDLTASGVGKMLSTGPVGWYKEHAFAFQEFTEYATATPIWIGAYRQALGEEKSEADAIAFADAIVRQVVVSHNPVDLSALMRDKGPIGYLTMFFGAFNHFYNQFRTLGHDFAEADTLKTRAAKAGKMMGLATGIFLIGSLVRGKGPDKDEEEWEWALRKVFLDGLMQTVPLVNVAGKAGDRALTKKQLPARDNSLFGLTERMGESVLKLAKDDTTDAARMKAFLDLVGPLTGLPTAGPTQIYDALMEWVLGPDLPN